ncbi:Uncharacterised protein [uncultured archaeon]|nr:Uncharacterised protein [uncultured archaeon]
MAAAKLMLSTFKSSFALTVFVDGCAGEVGAGGVIGVPGGIVTSLFAALFVAELSTTGVVLVAGVVSEVPVVVAACALGLIFGPLSSSFVALTVIVLIPLSSAPGVTLNFKSSGKLE